MSKFVEKAYGSTREILKFPDHYVALAVMVDDDGVSAVDGKKIVPKGTIVGGKGGSALASLDILVEDKNAPVAASLLTGDATAGTGIMWTAKDAGPDGNNISIVLEGKDAVSEPLAVAVATKKITVTLETDGTKAIVSTAADVADLVNSDNSAKALVVAAALSPTSEDPVEAMAEEHLVGGADIGFVGAEGVLMNDIDVTHGPKEGAMIIHGFVAIDKLPYGDDNDDAAAAAAAVLSPAIKFIK